MQNPWQPILQKLPLTRTEREVVRRYEADPGGRSFLPVADILRSHRHVDEALELLTQGVEKHPSFTVARVVLARELLQKGLVALAWRTIEDSPVSLRENVLAQKLRFKLSLLLGDFGVARSTYQHLLAHQMLDADTKKIGDHLELSGPEKARERLVKDLRERGVTVVMPTEELTSAANEAVEGSIGRSGQKHHLVTQHNPAAPLITDDQVEVRMGEGLDGFHVVPLDQIFRPGEIGADGSINSLRKDTAGVELDSTTLAEIYTKQGYYNKALSVYKRLARMSPGNELLRRKIAELSRMEREQTDVESGDVDAVVADRVETIEIIDREIKFYNEILSRLS